ncbi:response regulator transcription factor [Paenibacillus methanolicus]|uniref:Two-component system response regulator YesN n=1 Tax=Paenibacillus methanolicus TaxID=582686 RepID=A0A5S5BY47_9BACL|nr:response regulator [Paenibacillus methanolicus]TYP71060.1 two-component system response regulator YesN [Paenibacillus methanolicus]
MINAIIVDDEACTRESLKQFLPWDEMGVDKVETAKNGLAALEIARRLKPDILLTDVRMPKMDGLALAAEIRRLYPDCKIIFLSGYADKEYLKMAIELHATSYIEKPINLEEIKRTLAKAVTEYRDDAAKKADLRYAMQVMEETAPLLRQEITLELIRESADIPALTRKYAAFYPFAPSGSYFCAYARMNWNSDLNRHDRDSRKRTLLQLLFELPVSASSDCLAGFDVDDHLTLIIYDSQAPAAAFAEERLQLLLARLVAHSGNDYEVTLGAGRPVRQLSQIPPSYAEAVQASTGGFYLGTNRIITAGSIAGCRYDMDPSSCIAFRHNLNADHQAAAEQIVIGLTDEIRLSMDDDLPKIRHLFRQLLNIISEVAEDRGLVSPQLDGALRNSRDAAQEAPTLAELSRLVLQRIETLFGTLGTFDSVSRKISGTIRFIKENYSDPELTTQKIAAHSNFSHTYLCALFKKHTGKTLNEYITEVRMERAKELLKDSDLKLYEIASSIGYPGANYFSTLFKKHTGCSPTTFMKKYYL